MKQKSHQIGGKSIHQGFATRKNITRAAVFFIGLLGCHQLSALTLTAVKSDNGYPAHQVQWTDSAGLPRTAVLVDQNSTNAPYTGYLRRYTYQVNGANRTCTGTENYAAGGNLEFSGDGFVQNHTSASEASPDGGDFSSGNGGGVPGTTTITLQGTNHALITYSMPNYKIVNQAGVSVTVPTTVQWFFADGRSHPLFAIAQDARATTGNIAADSRSPYGDMAYDGDGTNAYVGGCSYGDTYKFVTLAAKPEEVTLASGWTDTQTNTIPYAMQWANPATVDAEMGHVATLPISLSDQGEDPQNYPVIDGRGTSQTNGPMLDVESWAFQIINDNFPARGPTTVKRLTWGACYGRVGGWDDSSPDYTDPRYPASQTNSLTQYNRHYDDPLGEAESGTRENGRLMAYSVFVVFGTHTGGYTNGTVGQQVIQMQNVTQASLLATIGTVATNGAAGIGGATNTTITYSPAGFDPTYASWDITAKTNAVNATLTVNAKYPLDHPIFIVNNYTARQLPGLITVGSGLTNAGVNYYASVDTNGQRLWITVNRLVTNALNLVVTSAGGSAPLPPVVSSFAPLNGPVGTIVTLTGSNFLGTTAVTFNGVTATNVTVSSATQISTTVPAGATTGILAVTTPGGSAHSASNFTVTAAAPHISGFSPVSGTAGTVVTLTGSNFLGATAVAFNGLPAASFTVNSAMQISATVATNATSGPVQVTTGSGSAQSSSTFTVLNPAAFLPIYIDNLLNGFLDYSWATNVNEFNSSPVYSGSNSISVTAGPYTALSLYHPDFSTTPYASLSFWINGGAAGASGIQVMGVTNHGDLQYYSAIYSLPALASNTWTQFNLPLSALGVADITNCQGFWFWPTLTGTTKFYVDSIQLNLAAATAKSNIAAIVASLPASPNPDAPSLAIVPGTPPVSGVVLLLGGKTGATYRLEASTDLRHWTPLSTNRLQTSTMTITNPVNPAWHCQYWRAVGP